MKNEPLALIVSLLAITLLHSGINQAQEMPGQESTSSDTTTPMQQHSGDTLMIPIGSQGQEATIKTPAKGLKQADVRNQYGEPESATDAVGEPPISRWNYPQFTVYFEGESVVHSVIRHQPQQ